MAIEEGETLKRKASEASRVSKRVRNRLEQRSILEAKQTEQLIDNLKELRKLCGLEHPSSYHNLDAAQLKSLLLEDEEALLPAEEPIMPTWWAWIRPSNKSTSSLASLSNSDLEILLARLNQQNLSLFEYTLEFLIDLFKNHWWCHAWPEKLKSSVQRLFLTPFGWQLMQLLYADRSCPKNAELIIQIGEFLTDRYFFQLQNEHRQDARLERLLSKWNLMLCWFDPDSLQPVHLKTRFFWLTSHIQMIEQEYLASKETLTRIDLTLEETIIIHNNDFDSFISSTTIKERLDAIESPTLTKEASITTSIYKQTCLPALIKDFLAGMNDKESEMTNERNLLQFIQKATVLLLAADVEGEMVDCVVFLYAISFGLLIFRSTVLASLWEAESEDLEKFIGTVCTFLIKSALQVEPMIIFLHDALSEHRSCSISSNEFLIASIEKLLTLPLSTSLLQCLHCCHGLYLEDEDGNRPWQHHSTPIERLEPQTASSLFLLLHPSFLIKLRLKDVAPISSIQKNQLREIIERIVDAMGLPDLNRHAQLRYSKASLENYLTPETISLDFQPNLNLFTSEDLIAQNAMTLVQRDLYGIAAILEETSLRHNRVKNTELYFQEIGRIMDYRFFHLIFNAEIPESWLSYASVCEWYAQEILMLNAKELEMYQPKLVELYKRSFLAYYHVRTIVKSTEWNRADFEAFYYNLSITMWNMTSAPLSLDLFFDATMDKSHYYQLLLKCLKKSGLNLQQWDLLHLTKAKVLWKLYPRDSVKLYQDLLSIMSIEDTDLLWHIQTKLIGCIIKLNNLGVSLEDYRSSLEKCLLLLDQPDVRLDDLRDKKTIELIMDVLTFIKVNDKSKHHHKAIYRISWICYSKGDFDLAKNELLQLFNLKPQARYFIYFWRGDFEPPGKHAVYVKKYTKFLLELLVKTKDVENTKFLVKKLAKSEEFYLNFDEIIKDSMLALLNMMDKPVFVPFKERNLEEALIKDPVLLMERMDSESWARLETLHELVELRKLKVEEQALNQWVIHLFLDFWERLSLIQITVSELLLPSSNLGKELSEPQILNKALALIKDLHAKKPILSQ